MPNPRISFAKALRIAEEIARSGVKEAAFITQASLPTVYDVRKRFPLLIKMFEPKDEE